MYKILTSDEVSKEIALLPYKPSKYLGFLIDWFTFSTKNYTLDQMLDLLGLSSQKWESGKGRYRHAKGLYFSSIGIYYENESEGCQSVLTVDMSGVGCRSFETYGTGDWMHLMECVFWGTLNATRFDVALDDQLGIIDFYDLAEFSRMRDIDGKRMYFCSQYKKVKVHFSDPIEDGSTLYWGSKKSDSFFRVYEKGKERGFKQSNWMRYELQLRHEEASDFIKTTVLDFNGDYGQFFKSYLKKKVRFCDYDPNIKHNWNRKTMEFWDDFLSSVEPAKPFDRPGLEYNAHRLHRYVVNQAGQAIACAIELGSADQLISMINKHRQGKDFDTKYQNLIDVQKILDETKEEKNRKVKGLYDF